MPGVLLDGAPVTSLEEYRTRGGGQAFAAAVAAGEDPVIGVVTASRLLSFLCTPR